MTNSVHQPQLSTLDREVLAVNETLLSSFQEAASYHGVIGNIFGLFFHDILAHFSGILFFRDRTSASSFRMRFPYVNLEYSKAPFVVSRDMYLSYNPVSNGFAQALRASRILPVAIGSGISWGYSNRAISGRMLSLLTAQQQFTKCYLPNQSEQVGTLIDCVKRICSQYSIANSEIVEANWRTYSEFHTTSDQIINPEKGAIVGSRMNSENRKIAINFLQQDKPVVGYTHGEICNEIMNEPAVGYAELGYCSVLVDYGDYKCDSDCNYRKPLVKATQTIRRDSFLVRKIYQPNVSIKTASKKSDNWLYVPNGYYESRYYGPFRDHCDQSYLRWQRALMEACPNLTIKVHPKATSFNEGPVETKRLEQCVQDYDVLIFDYYSTAMTVGIVTDKPILYFDIGLRNMSKEFRDDLRQRVFVAKIDSRANFGEQIRQAVDCFKQDDLEYTNLHFEKYVFTKEKNHEVWTPLRKIL